MKALFKLILGLALFFGSTHTMAKKITCKTPRGTKVLTIEDQRVSIQQPLRLNNERSVASVAGVRTKLEGNGFTKVLFHNGSKHIIHIDDSKSFSYVDDYLIIRSNEGHEMTYPLECK